MKLLLMERKLRLGLLLVTIEDTNQKKRLAKRSAMDNETSSSLCPHWVSTQDQLFQYSHICFVVAFCAPRIYKPSILFFRWVVNYGNAWIGQFWQTSKFPRFYRCVLKSGRYGKDNNLLATIKMNCLLLKPHTCLMFPSSFFVILYFSLLKHIIVC